jgi:hypothetical protein
MHPRCDEGSAGGVVPLRQVHFRCRPGAASRRLRAAALFVVHIYSVTAAAAAAAAAAVTHTCFQLSLRGMSTPCYSVLDRRRIFCISFRCRAFVQLRSQCATTAAYRTVQHFTRNLLSSARDTWPAAAAIHCDNMRNNRNNSNCDNNRFSRYAPVGSWWGGRGAPLAASCSPLASGVNSSPSSTSSTA